MVKLPVNCPPPLKHPDPFTVVVLSACDAPSPSSAIIPVPESETDLHTNSLDP
jgi:hypothetical protein